MDAVLHGVQAFLRPEIMLPAPFGEFFLKMQMDSSWTHYSSPQDGPDPAMSLEGSQHGQGQALATEIFLISLIITKLLSYFFLLHTHICAHTHNLHQDLNF